MRRLFLALLLCGCAERMPRLMRTPAEFRVEDVPFSVAPSANGDLMPPAWKLTNFAPDGADLRKEPPWKPDEFGPFGSRRHEERGALGIPVKQEEETVDLVFTADGGASMLVVARPRPSANGWSVRDLLERAVERTRIVEGILRTHRADPAPIRGMVYPAALEVPAGEAMQTSFEVFGGALPSDRAWIAAVRPRSHATAVFVMLVAPPATYEQRANEARDLAERLRFQDAQKSTKGWRINPDASPESVDNCRVFPGRLQTG